MDQLKIGRFLKELRLERGLTQEQTAELLGVTNRSVSRWENGNNMPDLSLLIEISKLYGVEIGELLDGERKNMADDNESTIEKIADYANDEKLRLTKTIRICLCIVLVLLISAFILDFLEVRSAATSFVKGVSMGAAFGMNLWLLILTTRLGERLRAAKLRLLKRVGKGVCGK